MAALDIAHVRYRNALALFDEFVRATVAHPDAATLRGLERRFAERLHIQPSYWSQIKSRARQIGERLARQFEVHCHKPPGWMDVPHGLGPVALPPPPAPGPALVEGARDDDERFIVDLVLSYYRRDPRHAKTRLLQLLGEALAAPPAAGPVLPAAAVPPAPASALPPAEAGSSAWARARLGVAPLKRKR